MKTERQRMILRMISEKPIETQDELVKLLREEGFNTTQATLSRDIRELQLIKTAQENGKYRYTEKKRPEPETDSRMSRILRDTLVSVDHAGHMIIIKTMSGSANVAGEVIDNLGWQEILGTIAGDNTILAVVRHEQDAAEVARRIRIMIQSPDY